MTPGRPVLYKIPATGAKPLTYSVDRLPQGLKVDPATGIITGTIKDKGTYTVTLRARNSAGEARKEFKFVAEGKLSLTPALGWNSWNARGRNVTEALVRRTADAFVDKGLIDHGWTYICIDDGWERSPRQTDELFEGPTRDENGNFITNKKFPDMKALGDYIHGKGLKFGIYSSPGPTTCQGLEASFQHEEQDVLQWCSLGCRLPEVRLVQLSGRRATAWPGMKKPYQLMRAILDKAPRDIVYSICQYGNGNVWEWGAEPDIGGNSWRTTGDIRDNWPQTHADRLQSALVGDRHRPVRRPRPLERRRTCSWSASSAGATSRSTNRTSPPPSSSPTSRSGRCTPRRSSWAATWPRPTTSPSAC